MGGDAPTISQLPVENSPGLRLVASILNVDYHNQKWVIIPNADCKRPTCQPISRNHFFTLQVLHFFDGELAQWCMP